MASHQGVGKVRHWEVPHLWLQEVVWRRAVAIQNGKRLVNPGDDLTKPISFDTMTKIFNLLDLAAAP